MRLLLFESFGGFGKGVGELLWKAANVLQNKLLRNASGASEAPGRCAPRWSTAHVPL